MAKLRLRPPLIGFGLSMIGPLLLQSGTEEQKREHLPKIVRGEIRWCQGYSEPGAGSDLASLQTRAVRDGDDFVVNGQKVWTSYGDKADWMFVLVRTDTEAQKHAGITFLLIDMAHAGRRGAADQLISGASPFCETFFEDVRVPVRNVVGEIDSGWTIAKALLGHERTMIADVVQGARRPLAAPEARARATSARPTAAASPTRVLRDRVTQVEMDQPASISRSRARATRLKAGHTPGPESSIFKLYGTELNQRRRELMVLDRRSAGPRLGRRRLHRRRARA